MDDDRVVHRRDADPVPRQAEARPVDRELAVQPDLAALVRDWLDGAARPLARVLDKLSPSEQAAFLQAMDRLEAERRNQDTAP